MNSIRNFFFLALVAACASAFSPLRFQHNIHTDARYSNRMKLFQERLTSDSPVKIKETIIGNSNDDSSVDNDFKASSNLVGVKQFVDNFLSAGGGEVGNRGEAYFFVQVALILCIAIGNFPLLGYMRLLAGPGMFVAGVVVLAMTAMDMGESITPWPKPNGQGLVQNGLYGQVRHPMYAGLLSVMVGFSIATASIDRLLLTAVLYMAIDIKSNYEEQELAKIYDDYPEYQKKVTSKFIPKGLLDLSKTNEEKE